MRSMNFSDAVDDALVQAMAENPRIVLLGEDIAAFRMPLFTRFGPERVRNAPISEAGFLGAAAAAAMAGLRPVVDLWMVDFLAVAMDALVNHAAKTETFSGGRWKVPLVVRAPCGAGYGDGGQHGQCFWGWLAHIPGLSVVVPACPADAGRLMLTALLHEGPVIFLEHKLLSSRLLDYLGTGGRRNLKFEIPAAGASGRVPRTWTPIPLGTASVCRNGKDITLISLGVGVHRCLEAAKILDTRGISSCVIDLRSVAPLDKETVLESVEETGRLLVVDEDYQGFGLSGELAAVVLEAGLSMSFGRVCTEDTIPFSMKEEREVLPNTERIVKAVERLFR